MNSDAIAWAERACRSVMATYTPETLPPEGKWHYHQGVFLLGALRLWRRTGDESLYEYAKRYVDHNIAPDGSFEYRKGELDAIQAGMLLFPLWERTKDERYRTAMRTLARLLESRPTTSDGGFWHKEIYPNQLWLDGLYMEGPFAVRYAELFDEPRFYDIVADQAFLIERHTRDPKTGLLRHAWEETRNTSWADPATGRAPEFWGRAMGWFPAALLDMLDRLPADHRAREGMIAMYRSLIEAIVKVQDEKTGLWYQVLDKGDRPENWLETSCSSLFVYSLSKGVTVGLLDRSYAQYARKGFEGVLTKISGTDDGRIEIRDICVGTGVGNYEHYIKRDRKTNDLHGVGAFVLSTIELQRMNETLG
jgi:unsaturated rhamnogalacturonyl hydrolase